MEFVAGGLVVAALVWAFVLYRDKAIDRSLELEMQAAVMEARRTLSAEDLAALRQQGRDLEDIGRVEVQAGRMSPHAAMRQTKRLIIQSAYASLEVHRMFNGEGQQAPTLRS